MRLITPLAVLILSTIMSNLNLPYAVGDDAKPPRPLDQLPANKELPDPFTFNDGSLVKTEADWTRRRLEIKDLFQDYMYGHLPPRPQRLQVERGTIVVDRVNNLRFRDFQIKLKQESQSITLHMRLALPENAGAPAPVVIEGRGTNYTDLGDPAHPNPGAAFAPFTNRGFAVAELYFPEVALDNKETARTEGIYQLFGDQIDCGTLMAWAWGIGRVIDVLQTLPEIDKTKIVVTGHSRYGKAALVAGAFDDRIALTVPSHSGAAGSAPYRFIYGKNEQLPNSVSYAPQWFRPGFAQFVDHVEQLPVDQHLLAALIAPRALLKTEGTKDDWTNPEGAQLTYLATRKVYDFLYAGDKTSIRFRPVGHIPNNDDLMDYADHIFAAKPLSEEFGQLAYPEEKNAFHWDIPK